MDQSRKIGRPPKFKEGYLLETVKTYVKTQATPTILKKKTLAREVSKITQMQHGLKTLAIDISRDESVLQFIDEYNNMVKKIIFGSGTYSLDTESALPMYEPISIEGLLDKCKTPKDLEKITELLNTKHKKLTEQCGVMQKKIINQTQKLLEQQAEIKSLQEQLKAQEEQAKVAYDLLREQVQKLKGECKALKSKIVITDEIMDLYHYDKLFECAIYLEGRTGLKLPPDAPPLLDETAYKSGNASLSQMVEVYQKIVLGSENKLNQEQQPMVYEVLASSTPIVNEPQGTLTNNFLEEQKKKLQSSLDNLFN